MINLVTFEQGIQLKRLGFREQVRAYYIDGNLDFNNPINWNTNEGLDENGEYQEEDEYCSAPTVSEALDWVRERKGTPCGAYPNKDVYDEDVYPFVGYSYVYFNGIAFIKEDNFDTHPLASSALLSAVLEYLIEKEK